MSANEITGSRFLLDDLSHLMASRLFDNGLAPVTRDAAKEAQVLELLSGWLEHNAITVHPYAQEDCVSATVCWWDVNSRTSPERLSQFAALVLGWFMLDSLCRENDRYAMELADNYWQYGQGSADPRKRAIYLCNSHYASGTAPEVRNHLTHYMKEWAYGSLFENSWSQESGLPHDILVRSRGMMTGLLPALTASLTPAEVQAWEQYAHINPDLDLFLTLSCRHITFVNDIVGLTQPTAGEPNAAASYTHTLDGGHWLARYANSVVDEMELRYRHLSCLDDSTLTSLCDKAIRFCSGNATWSLTCHRYNEAVTEHDSMFESIGEADLPRSAPPTGASSATQGTLGVINRT